MVKVQELREIIKLIDQTSITEFKYEKDDVKVSVKKNSGESVVQQAEVVKEVVNAAPAAPKVEAPAAQPKAAEPEVKEEKPASTADFDFEIVSPMVGTFYIAPSPEDDPYVSVGDQVKDDTIVCIVEAMKLFNEIEAEVEGEIVEICAEDGELVEFGQPLFRVKKK